MKNTKLLVSLLSLFLLPGLVRVSAQTFINSWTQSSPAVTVGVDTNGTFVATGPMNSSATLNSTETGSNPKLLWIPATCDLSFGQNAHASGGSFAEGFWAYATGFGSIALGTFDSASGNYSVSLGGAGNNASGQNSFATGSSTYATGLKSATFNQYTHADGSNSAAFNDSTHAKAYDSFTVGRANVALAEDGVTAVNLTAWVATDPVFEVGNGISADASSNYTAVPSDAFVVYKNGDAVIQSKLKVGGVITAAAGGDIPMYTGN